MMDHNVETGTNRGSIELLKSTRPIVMMLVPLKLSPLCSATADVPIVPGICAFSEALLFGTTDSVMKQLTKSFIFV
ncbi:hypothetical protein N5J48_14455 [Acinetobacter ursingii]|nr:MULTISPECIES: hypothetical protein [Acinetobacter]MDG9861834.1 hypothetical protein [Acinetobacter ursingii]MDG9895494.1 hypothetical protein [Acinetobacter ursingii]MDH0480801.1 hypothetical protein [Acinetobacter ursingii]MDH2121374.1 hypothetical protein [Acinetobacter ursingii]MDH2128752.1 hypothetical protein [Acinetobacter ursingii]